MKLLGLGDHVIDYYTNLGVMYPGGNALNVAVHASLLGADASYMGNLGDDSMSHIIRDALNQFHVDASRCKTIPGATTKHCRYLINDGERTFLNIEYGNNWSGPMHLTSKHLDYLNTFSLIHSCCNAKMEDEMELIGNLPVVFTYDFGEKEKYRVPEYYNKICHHLDLALFSCPYMNKDEAKNFCEPLHQMGVKHILITMGSHGQYCSNGTDLIHGASTPIIPVDTMGAGDSFLTAFVISLLQKGWKKGDSIAPNHLQEALQAGTIYSTENCTKEGSFGYKALTSP